MGQQVVFNDPMVLPEVSATLITPYSCPMGHHGHSFLSKNGRKRLKTGFDDTYLRNLLFYKQAEVDILPTFRGTQFLDQDFPTLNHMVKKYS
jgi:hypothetical protein